MGVRITPNLWFDGNAEEAVAFYGTVFAETKVLSIARYPANAPGPEGEVMTIEFELDGNRFVGINGGPQFSFDEAVSFEIACADQAEVDHYWERLTDGGEEGPCGWLKDRFGLSWQVVPAGMQQLFEDPDPSRVERAMQAMMTMTKLDVAALRAAAATP